MSGEESVVLCVVAEGPAEASRFESLEHHAVEVSVVSAPEGAATQPQVLNRLVDGATTHWILLVRAGERVPEDLAAEIARNATSDPRAWGYRISVRSLYCGLPLALGGRDPGDVRLFHRRRARLQPDGRMKVQGTVVRLQAAFDLVVHESEEAHAEALRQGGGVPTGVVTRVFAWLHEVARHFPHSLARSARRYIWIESGWQRSPTRD